MKSFLSKKHAALVPYTPGEQPQNMEYVKLNTNESPYPPAQAVIDAAAFEAGKLNLYCDPTCRVLCEKAAELYGVGAENILPVNGSDEILYFAFMAFCDEDHPMACPDISYGFYPVYGDINHVPLHIIPLKEDFSIDPEDYIGLGENIVIANPNAPTGMCLPVSDIERIVAGNPDNVVIIDEAYIDFGGESCIPLIKKYDNLLVTQTFSKSRSMAGGRLGFGIACEDLIRDLNTIKYSTNPYNINRMTQACGVASIENNEYYMQCCRAIADCRAYTTAELEKLGFTVLPSKANFVFASCPAINGGDYYRALKERGVLVRHFDKDRISDYVRISIGTKDQMDVLLEKTIEILKERGAMQ